jgi:hypothetical protein
MKTLTLEQTLHPAEWTCEDATPAGSPWETFFREARGDIPIAIAEPVEENTYGSATPTRVDVVDAEVVVPSKDEPSSFPPMPTHTEEDESPPGRGCFFLEGLVGGILTLVATVIIFALEMCGALVYVIAVGLNFLASEDSLMPGLLKAVFSLVVHTLMLVDAICLFCSVFVSEKILVPH